MAKFCTRPEQLIVLHYYCPNNSELIGLHIDAKQVFAGGRTYSGFETHRRCRQKSKECGCGPGHVAEWLARRIHDVMIAGS